MSEKLKGIWYYFPEPDDSPGYTQLLLHESETDWINCIQADFPDRKMLRVEVTIREHPTEDACVSVQKAKAWCPHCGVKWVWAGGCTACGAFLPNGPSMAEDKDE